MTIQKTTWVGSAVGDYVIGEELADGPFSTLYLGQGAAQPLPPAVFKVAKPMELAGSSALGTGAFATQARMTIIGGTQEFKPDCAELLKRQFEWLQTCRSKEVVAVRDLVEQPGLTYFSMEYLGGKTFRQIIDEEPVSLDQLIELVRAYKGLSQHVNYTSHGDLKPENIIFTERGPVFIDPGYFGPLSDGEETLPHCAITTPAYYPCLLPDDMLAFGLMFWEAVFKEQPLKASGFSGDLDLSLVGPKLLAMVREQEFVGMYFLSSILRLASPRSDFKGLSDEMQTFLLKLLRLQRLRNGILELHQGFQSVSALSGSLLLLQSKGSKLPL